MNTYTDFLIQKHRSRGILLDTNLLMLYLIGNFSKKDISRFKRTRSYTTEDFVLLKFFVSNFMKLLTTPNILTEACNLTDPFNKSTSYKFFASLSNQIKALVESYHESYEVSKASCFRLLGLADAVSLVITRDSGCLILTDDLTFFNYLQQKQLPAINFNHIRTQVWKL